MVATREGRGNSCAFVATTSAFAILTIPIESMIAAVGIGVKLWIHEQETNASTDMIGHMHSNCFGPYCATWQQNSDIVLLLLQVFFTDAVIAILTWSGSEWISFIQFSVNHSYRFRTNHFIARCPWLLK